MCWAICPALPLCWWLRATPQRPACTRPRAGPWWWPLTRATCCTWPRPCGHCCLLPCWPCVGTMTAPRKHAQAATPAAKRPKLLPRLCKGWPCSRAGPRGCQPVTVKTLTICTRRRACKRCRRVCKRRLWPLLLLRPLHPAMDARGEPSAPSAQTEQTLPLVLLAMVALVTVAAMVAVVGVAARARALPRSRNNRPAGKTPSPWTIRACGGMAAIKRATPRARCGCAAR